MVTAAMKLKDSPWKESYDQPRQHIKKQDLDAGRDWGQEDKGMTEDEMVGWYHQLDGHQFG